MHSSLQLMWISCTAGGPSRELLAQSRRLAEVRVSASRQAIAAIAEAAPNVVVFEADNPLAADLQLLLSLRRVYPSVPVLMITAKHSEELAVWAFRARVWNYLVKPVQLRELKSNLQKLEIILSERRGAARQVARPGALLPASVNEADDQSESALLQKITARVRDNYASGLRVSKLARECGMSRFSFSRLFSERFGCSFREYVMRLRIEAACRLLEAPHPSVIQVACAAGFADASYFARIFRRHKLQSPIEYAREYAKSA